MSCAMKYPNPKDEPLQVNEAATAYVRSAGRSADAGFTFMDFLKDRMLILDSIRNGITHSFFEAIKGRMPFSDQDWADYFNVSLKSMQRYKNDSKHVFKPILSEKIIQMAEVIEEGRLVFGDDEKLFRWLDTPSLALGGYKPKDLLSNAYGQRMVRAELNAIEHGIFA